MRNIKEEHLDLVKQFFKEDIDFEKLLRKKGNDRKSVSTYSLDPYNVELNDDEKKHLLRRSLVGVSKRHLDDLNGLNFDQIFDLIFSPDTLEEPTNFYYYQRSNKEWNEIYGKDDVLPGEPFINIANSSFEESGDPIRRSCIQSHILSNFYNQKTSIHWKLFLFLHNLVPTDGGGGNKGLWDYYKLIFDSCFTSYKDFIYDITINPSMLLFLNLNDSVKETPDENYAREVQELFTVGKRPFSMFTESDVREAARLLVGFQVDWNSQLEEGEIEYQINPDNHDQGDKQFSSFYGNRKIQGRNTLEGILEELREFVEMLFYPEQTKQYIARRLYQFFVNPEVTDEIEQNIIIPLSEIFENSNYSLTETLKVLLKSKHFFDKSNFFRIIKSPYDYLFSLYKELDIYNGAIKNYQLDQNNFTIPNRLSNQETLSYYINFHTEALTNDLGMTISIPPNVSGWQPYYQKPVYDLFWINSFTISSRRDIAEACCKWGLNVQDGFMIKANIIYYLFTYDNNEDIDNLLDEITERLLSSNISEQDKERIISYALGGASKMHWTELVREYKNGNENTKWDIEGIFENIMFQVFSLGEYNLY